MVKHFVHVSEETFVQMLMNGFEAFVVKHQNKKRHAIEMHASIYGWVKETSRTLHHYIDFISVDTSAEMTAGYVLSKSEAETMKEKIAHAFGFSMLGSLHSHPYLSHEIDLPTVRARGSRFSEGKESDLTAFALGFDDEGLFYGEKYALHCVLTIRNKDGGGEVRPAERQRTEKDGFVEGTKNIFELSLANCKCFLNVQVFSISEDGELVFEQTELKCPYLENFEYLGQRFGSVRVAEGKQRIVEHRPD